MSRWCWYTEKRINKSCWGIMYIFNSWQLKYHIMNIGQSIFTKISKFLKHKNNQSYNLKTFIWYLFLSLVTSFVMFCCWMRKHLFITQIVLMTLCFVWGLLSPQIFDGWNLIVLCKQHRLNLFLFLLNVLFLLHYPGGFGRPLSFYHSIAW